MTWLWLTLIYFGKPYIDGIIGHIASKHFDAITEKLKKLCSSWEDGEENATGVSIRFAYDDVDIEFNLPELLPKDYLTDIAKKIQEHSPKLASISGEAPGNRVRYIEIPYTEVDGHWSVPDDWKVSEDADRYWGIGRYGEPFVTDIYDSQAGRFLDLPYNALPEPGAQ